MTAPSAGAYGQYLGDSELDGIFDDTTARMPAGEGDAPVAAQSMVDETAPIPGGGRLLEEPNPAKLFKILDGIVKRQERVAKNREQKALHWTRIRNGVPFSYLEKNEDRSIFRATLAPGIEDIGQPIPNKMDDLCNKIISQVLVDDYLPNPKADGDSDRDRGAADLAKKFLRDNGLPAGTDDKQMARDVLNMNITKASAFVVVWVDPTGGGWRPKQIKAHPRAEDPAKPLYAPRLDPMGQPVMTATGPIMEKSSAPILRYVSETPDPSGAVGPDGQPQTKQAFTDNAAEAARLWLPKHRRRILNANQVRTVPQSATAFEADQIIVLMYDTLGEARKRFKVLSGLSDEKIKQLTSWRPKRWKSIVPESHRPQSAEEGGTTDDALLFWYWSFCRISPNYQDGGEVAVNGAGGGFVFKRDTLREDVELDEGHTVPVLMDPPVTQFVALTDTEDGDAFGMAPMARFGGGNEAWGHIWVGLLDALHQALNRNRYIPSTSPVTREDINRRDGTPIEILTAADKPEMEEAPELPGFVTDILERLELTLNSAAGINETATGLDSQYSVSGVAKDISIKQARTALAQYWQNFVKGLTGFWRIVLQQAQARLTVPQLVAAAGVESAYKQPWFVGSDLVGVSKVTLDPGSGTMMNAGEKTQWLGALQDRSWLDPEQAGEVARASMTDDLGLAPNIHEEAINREIATWSDGPPAGWEDEFRRQQQVTAQYQAATQQQVAALVQGGIDEQTATAQVQQASPAPQLPALYSPFENRPNVDEPAVAVIRHRRLVRLISSAEFSKHPADWQGLVAQEYDRARKAAIPLMPTLQTAVEAQQVAEQQAQAAAAQQGAAQQASDGAGAAKEQAKAAEADKARQFQADQNAQDRDAQQESEARRGMVQDARQAAGRRPPVPTHV